MKRIIFTLVSVFFLFGCSEEEPTSCPVCANPLLDSSAVVLVTKVSDGDTFSFIERDEEIDVRILGIDCFETRRGSRLTEQATGAGITEDSALALGFEAKRLADSILYQHEVTIYRDTTQKNFDNFGRLLRHVYAIHNGKQINFRDTIVARGLSVP